MNTFEKLERQPLSEQVAAHIEAAIVDGAFPVGSQLPSEQQLANQFGVSRNVVREAFKFLKGRELIVIQNGNGATVSSPSPNATSSALGRYIRMLGAHENIAHLYEIRRLLEGDTAKQAALRARDEDLRELEAALLQMEQHVDSIEEWSRADLEFHLVIARATHNPFHLMLLQPLVDQLHEVIAEGYREVGAVERGLEAHRELYRCIKMGDSEGAYQAIIDHLRDSEARINRLSAGQSRTENNI